MIHHKICFIGASAVGKTSLIRRYVDGIFSDKYLTTIGVKIDKKQVNSHGSLVELLIWDIEGTDSFCGFQSRYLKGASAYVLVIDQSRPSSFNDALSIYDLAAEEAKQSGTLAFLVMNKSDLPCQLNEQHLAQIRQLAFIDQINTSAKSGDNVEMLFSTIANALLARNVENG